MIYYSIIFNDELDLLKLQLEVNYNFVDKFVITESEKTHSNKNKKRYYYENKEKFEMFSDKIIYLNADLDYFELIKNYPLNLADSNLDTWSREQKQRNYLFEILDFTIDDIVINVDVDEIIFVESCKDKIIKNKVNFFNLDHRRYYFNCRCLKNKNGWQRSIALNPIIYKPFIFETWNIRFLNDFISDVNIIKNAGYHFSWCTDIETKIKSFSHQELNNTKDISKYINNKNFIKDCELTDDLPEFIKTKYKKYIYDTNK